MAKDETSKKASEPSVDPHLLEILVCPLTKTRLTYDAANSELISTAAGLAFPIRDGVPLMTPQAARPLKGDNS
ncbi:MAG: Trm112 family protein [Hyphomicrobiaceae bacterium]